MLAATPIEGTHYLSDMLAGLLVAQVAIPSGYFIQDLAAQGANSGTERSFAPS